MSPLPVRENDSTRARIASIWMGWRDPTATRPETACWLHSTLGKTACLNQVVHEGPDLVHGVDPATGGDFGARAFHRGEVGSRQRLIVVGGVFGRDACDGREVCLDFAQEVVWDSVEKLVDEGAFGHVVSVPEPAPFSLGRSPCHTPGA